MRRRNPRPRPGRGKWPPPPGTSQLFSTPDNSSGPRAMLFVRLRSPVRSPPPRLLPGLSFPTARVPRLQPRGGGGNRREMELPKRLSENRERVSLRWASCPPCAGLFSGCFSLPPIPLLAFIKSLSLGLGLGAELTSETFLLVCFLLRFLKQSGRCQANYFLSPYEWIIWV